DTAHMSVCDHLAHQLENCHKSSAVGRRVRPLLQNGIEGPPHDQFHDHERTSVQQGADIEHRWNTWVLQLGRDPYMVTKSACGLWVSERSRGRNFACDLPPAGTVAQAVHHSQP